jgi:Tol biopolymer transport system component
VDGEVDGNGDVLDVLVVDLATGKAVNVTGGGDAASFGASVSADGSAVAFSSAATNLVEGQGDGNHAPDIFVHDLATGETVNLSLTIGRGGSFEPSISADGSRVAFRLDGDGTQDILVMDTATSAQEGGGWIEVTEGGDGSSFAPSLSGDGSRVAFESTATNLVAGEADANGATADVFLHDLATGETINVTEGGDAASFGASVSADGSKVVFTSAATNLVAGETDGDGGALDVFLFDLDTGEVTNVTEGWAGEVASAGISADGSTVAFLHLPPDQQPTPYDPIYERDLILHDVATGEAANVTEGWDGYVARASVSADGSEGTFSAVPKAGMYTDVFVWEMS